LSDAQKTALFDGDLKLLYSKFSKTNVPLIYAGRLRLFSDTTGFRVSFRVGEKTVVEVTGTGDIAQVEKSAQACIRQKAGCELDAKFLGIVWRSEQKGRNIVLNIVPLALW
jgi:hypothetical protein